MLNFSKSKIFKALRVVAMLVVLLSAALMFPVQKTYAEPVKIWIAWSCIYIEF